MHALGTPPALILSQDQTLHQGAPPPEGRGRLVGDFGSGTCGSGTASPRCLLRLRRATRPGVSPGPPRASLSTCFSPKSPGCPLWRPARPRPRRHRGSVRRRLGGAAPFQRRKGMITQRFGYVKSVRCAVSRAIPSPAVQPGGSHSPRDDYDTAALLLCQGKRRGCRSTSDESRLRLGRAVSVPQEEPGRRRLPRHALVDQGQVDGG